MVARPIEDKLTLDLPVGIGIFGILLDDIYRFVIVR